MFALVCVLTLMVASPESRYSKAGLYAIFATQSNDFALGYPIGELLFMRSRRILSSNNSKNPQLALLSDNSVFEHPVEALYGSTYPEYLQYIYLVAPVSLMLLNPIGFALCEVQKWRQTSQSHHRKLDIAGVVILQVGLFFPPLVIIESIKFYCCTISQLKVAQCSYSVLILYFLFFPELKNKSIIIVHC